MVISTDILYKYGVISKFMVLTPSIGDGRLGKDVRCLSFSVCAQYPWTDRDTLFLLRTADRLSIGK